MRSTPQRTPSSQKRKMTATTTNSSRLQQQSSPSLSSSSSSNTSLSKLVKTYSFAIFLVLGGVWGIWLIYLPMPDSAAGAVHEEFILSSSRRIIDDAAASDAEDPFLPAFHEVLERAKKNKHHCQTVIAEPVEEPELDVIAIANMTTARLRGFGVIEALEEWKNTPQQNVNHNDIAAGASDTQCILPPELECGESQFTVIFMAYNPDRLKKLMNQIRQIMFAPPYSDMVREIVLVWNGPREISESDEGRGLLDYVQQERHRLRVVYPLNQGLPNDLMNRYHPDIVQAKTNGILYYDDDGPFYSYEAILGGFELWKRNANAQIGAMARVIDLGPRQLAEKQEMLQNDDPHNDRAFISHCEPEDDVEYNYRFFANFQANMVLPSGSFLHSNYLCFLWHPAFEPIREYVRAHPVHPDDVTVSMMVSQLAGRAPKVYSRRINMETRDDQLQEAASMEQQQERRRRLMFNINWDKGSGMNDDKEKWAQLRSGAINSLVRYFGSINSGSIGWCYGTEFHQKDKNGDDQCSPEMARFGKLPWMKIDHTPKDTCP